jgi:hypothetical protein
MAVLKKKATKKTNKKIVKKHVNHKAVEKKVEEVIKPQTEVIKQDTPIVQQDAVSENTALPSVMPSGVLPDIPKEETPQPQTLPPQPLQQATDTLTSQPASAISTPSTETTTNKVESIGIVTQNPLAADNVVSDKPEQEHIVESKKKRSWVIIGIIIVVVVIFIVGILWYFREKAAKQISVKNPIASTPSPSKISPTSASDSAKLAIDYSKYKIKVLNGSGIAGAAAKGKEILEKELFMVVEIGNAETSDYDLTIIQAKKGVDKAFLDKLKSVLGETYLLGSDEVLEELEELDVVVIIGSGKKQP